MNFKNKKNQNTPHTQQTNPQKIIVLPEQRTKCRNYHSRCNKLVFQSYADGNGLNMQHC